MASSNLTWRKYKGLTRGQYCGPGAFTAPASKEVNEACKRHDERYGRYGNRSYLYFSEADRDFIKELQSLNPKKLGVTGRIALRTFQTKQKIAPVMPQAWEIQAMGGTLPSNIGKRRIYGVPGPYAKRAKKPKIGREVQIYNRYKPWKRWWSTRLKNRYKKKSGKTAFWRKRFRYRFKRKKRYGL